tara:strand:+ start:1311 stop:1553 length:243 start_codon:yes stop_codon:yes gene_type:complete
MEKKMIKYTATISVIGTAYIEVEIPAEEYIKDVEYGEKILEDYLSLDIDDLDIDFSDGVEIADDNLEFPKDYDEIIEKTI